MESNFQEMLATYNALVEKLGEAKLSKESGSKVRELKRRFKEIKESIAKATEEETAVALVQDMLSIKKQLAELGSVTTSGKEKVNKAALRKQIADMREALLKKAASETNGFENWVGFFKDNPVVLTAIIKTVGWEDMDNTVTLNRNPFRGAAVSPARKRYNYVAHTEDGDSHTYDSVRELLASLDSPIEKSIPFSRIDEVVNGGTISGSRITSVTRHEIEKASE